MRKSETRFYLPSYWPTWIGIGLLRLIACLPLPIIHVLGSGLGLLVYTLFRSRREVALRNIQRCFPEFGPDEHERITRKHFQELAKSTLSTGINWWANTRRLKKLIQTRDRHHLDDALAAGHNVILLAPHFVALEIGGIFVSSEVSVVSMYQRTKNELVDQFIRNGRARFGAQLVERKAEMRNLVRQIKSGKPFYYLPDQAPGRRHGIFTPFFGIKTATFPVLSKFAQLGKAKVIPCFTRQLPGGGGYEVIFKSALAPFPTNDVYDDTAYMNKVIEQGVREMPEQYFWVHKRFKVRPDGEKDFYI